MPPMLNSSIQKPGVGKPKPISNPFDRTKAMKITETTRGGKPYFQVYSVSGRLLGAAASRPLIEKLRDSYPLTVCLS